MKTLFRVLSFCFILVSLPAHALEGSRIHQILSSSRLALEDFGIHIRDDKKDVFAFNAGKKFKPASVSKVITGAASLELLGPNFKFRTHLLYDGSIVDGALRGSIYLRGGGDPSFHSGKLSTLLTGLTKHKIKTIEGDLIVDNSRFRDITDSQWQSHIQTINAQMFPLFVRREPPADLANLQQTRIHRKLMDLEGRFVVYQNMIEPDLRTGQQLIQMIHKSGIRFKGKVKRGVVSKSATILAEVTTPLTKVVSYMLKTSNNFYADLLVRNIAVAFGERPGTFQTGIDFLTFYLDHVNISRSEYSLNSGSGFSHQNTITPRAMVSLLKHLKNEKIVSPYFMPSLPVAGVDGTLARRMKTTSPKGRVRAKTGYLRQVANKTHQFDGAVALAGYALSLKDQPYIFTFLYNGNAAPETVKTVFDKICEEVVGKLPVVKKASPARKKKSIKKSPRKRSVRKS